MNVKMSSVFLVKREKLTWIKPVIFFFVSIGLFFLGLFMVAKFAHAATKIGSSLGTLPGTGRQLVRTSAGTLYAFINNAGTCEIFKSTNGTTWTEQDSVHHLLCSSGVGIGLAVDSTDQLDLGYIDNVNSYVVHYDTFNTSTNLFGTPEIAYSSPPSTNNTDVEIAVDSNNKPHVAFHNGSSGGETIIYINKVSGSWTSLNVPTASGNISVSSFSLTIDKDNVPEIADIMDDTGVSGAIQAEGWLGNANNASSFTQKILDTTINNTSGTRGISMAIDSSGNTWVSYVDATGTNNINLIEHIYGNAWSTWQTAVTDSHTGKQPSLATNGTNVYVFYQNSGTNIVYDKYNGSWSGETVLDTGTYQGVKVKWSYLNDNQPTNFDFIFSDGTDVYYDKLSIGPTTIVFTNTAVSTTAGTCSTLTVQLQSGGVAINPSGTDNVLLSSTSPGGLFTTVAGCGSGTSSTLSLSYNISTNTQTVYYLDTRKSSTTWTLTAHESSGADTLSDGTQTATITAGTVSQLVISLPGQTFIDGTGNSGTVTNQTAGSPFVLSKISATDAYDNLNTAYAGAKTLTYSGPINSPNSTVPSYTTAISFTSGQSTTTLTTTLTDAQTTTIFVTESGHSYGVASSSLVVAVGSLSTTVSSVLINGSSTVSVALNTNVPITITLADSDGNDIPGILASSITFSGATPTTAVFTILRPIQTTDSNGTTTPYLSWSTSGSKTVVVYVNGSQLTSQPVVTVTAAATPNTSIGGGANFKGGVNLK